MIPDQSSLLLISITGMVFMTPFFCHSSYSKRVNPDRGKVSEPVTLAFLQSLHLVSLHI